MTLIAILLATLVAGVGSVWLAACLSFGVFVRYMQHMLSLAAGALLATAFMNLLPEAFEMHANAQALFTTLLLGLIFFFLLDKAELWHHGHEHHHQDTGFLPAHLRTSDSVRGELVENGSTHDYDDSGRHHHLHAHGKRTGSWALLTGDGVHCFGDGVLIASAFMADPRVGWVVALAVMVHEVPHHMGDLAVLRESTNNKRAAILKVSLAGALTALGGLLGYFLVAQLQRYIPFFLVVAASSFLYVALADLIPQLQKKLNAKETAAQILWLSIGVALVTLLNHWAHAHG